MVLTMLHVLLDPLMRELYRTPCCDRCNMCVGALYRTGFPPLPHILPHILPHSLPHRKPASGIQYLISKGIVRDTPKSVARFLREQNGLSKLKIREFVGEIRYEFNMAVLE